MAKDKAGWIRIAGTDASFRMKEKDAKIEMRKGARKSKFTGKIRKHSRM